MKVIYVDDERSAHINFYYSLKDCTMVASTDFFFNGEDAIAHMKEHKVDCAFLDINLGGNFTGIQLAKELSTLQPDVEVVFITGYDEFAREAYRVGGRGYLTKPYTQEDMDAILSRLKKLHLLHAQEGADVQRPQDSVVMKAFGNFDLLVEGRPVAFKNAKAKELLAFLVHQRGGSVSSSQLFLALWEHLEYTATTSTYVRRTVRALREELEAIGLADILISKRNCYSVDVTRFACDYYNLLAGEPGAGDYYNGEYLHQYSWGESTIPLIERKLSNVSY